MGLHWREVMAAQRPDWVFVGTKTDGTYNHEGVGGDKTTDILVRLEDIPPADTYTLLAGSNDIRALTWRDVIVKNLQTIADALAAKGGTVFVCTPPPTALEGDVNIVLNRLRFAIKANIQGHAVIDTHQAFLDSGYALSELFVSDKAHPSSLGYDVLSSKVLESIQ